MKSVKKNEEEKQAPHPVGSSLREKPRGNSSMTMDGYAAEHLMHCSVAGTRSQRQ